ncbi:hypothetical protein HJG60_009412 [Phyllostomus discolor]|uniref:Uncharacterized protein n=1 Tax=Phyllostomus discolor TaxID=89673 RepID=A0A834DCR6_9CHIR|nr:hypothetical protein HJG60_009412 [Phyllostomus discolor]
MHPGPIKPPAGAPVITPCPPESRSHEHAGVLSEEDLTEHRERETIFSATCGCCVVPPRQGPRCRATHTVPWQKGPAWRPSTGRRRWREMHEVHTGARTRPACGRPREGPPAGGVGGREEGTGNGRCLEEASTFINAR